MLKIERKALLAALKRCKAVTARSTTPIFECVHMSTAGDRLHLRVVGPHAEEQLTLSIPAKGQLDPVAVPLDALERRCRAANCTELSIHPCKGEQGLQVDSNHASHALCARSASDFPSPIVAEGEPLMVDAPTFARAVRTCLTAASCEQSSFAISGALLERDAQGSRLVATDGRRLVIHELGDSGKTGGPLNVIIPARALYLLPRVFDVSRGKKQQEAHGQKADAAGFFDKTSGMRLEIYAQDGRIRIVQDDIELSCYAVEGTFPKYRDLVPRKKDVHLYEFDPTELSALVREVAVSTDEENRGIRLAVAEGRCKVSSATSTGESSAGECPCSDDGTPTEIGINPGFLAKALDTIGAERVTLWIGEPTWPVVVSSPKSPVRWIVMPITLQSGG